MCITLLCVYSAKKISQQSFNLIKKYRMASTCSGNIKWISNISICINTIILCNIYSRYPSGCIAIDRHG